MRLDQKTKKLCMEICEILREGHNPYTKIIITGDLVELTEVKEGIPFLKNSDQSNND